MVYRASGRQRGGPSRVPVWHYRPTIPYMICLDPHSIVALQLDPLEWGLHEAWDHTSGRRVQTRTFPGSLEPLIQEYTLNHTMDPFRVFGMYSLRGFGLSGFLGPPVGVQAEV